MGCVLYITEPGAYVRQTSARLRVEKDGALLREVRLEQVERVVLLGRSAGLTPQAAAALLDAGAEAAFLSSRGELRGWLAPAVGGKGVALRLAQLRAYEDPVYRLRVARAIVDRKIRSADAVLDRFARNHAVRGFDAAPERARMARALAAAAAAPNAAALLGCEGDAAAAYFLAFGRMLGGGFSFTARSRRPPRDPANALLSFGYALLTAEALTALIGAGLEPALGMLHALEDGRPSLALDLTEEFRQPVVDRLVLHVANNRLLSPEADFTAADSSLDMDPADDAGAAGPGTRLSPAARRRYLGAYEERMTAPFALRRGGSGGGGAAQTTLRECLRGQARRLADALRDRAPYTPFSLRA